MNKLAKTFPLAQQQRLLGQTTRQFSSIVKSQTKISSQLRRWQPPASNYDPQFGDYPKMEWIPYDKRDPNLNWDDPVHRRMFGETIPEEFDLQDAYFPGEHDPMYNFLEGMKSQYAIAGIGLVFVGLAYLTFDPVDKVVPREQPESVIQYLRKQGKDRIVNRPYETAVQDPSMEHIVANVPLNHGNHH